jgi:S-adenosylmethionine:tRNA ribosyltransferase-isomerase
MSDHTFLELADLLDPGDLVVVNETRVRAARLNGRRADTGGAVEILILDNLGDGTWEALARPARRLRPGLTIEFHEMTGTIVEGPSTGKVRLQLDANDPEETIRQTGSIPLPPYFTGHLDDPDRYQTMFASSPGSAAAPTAGLHFTPEVVQRLEDRHIPIALVDLHVSLDTFRPMSTEEIEDHHMHSEWCAVPAETADAVAGTRQSGGKVVAIGTTVVRTLETMADGAGGVQPGERRTDLFLTPESEISVVDVLVTNFHLPGSTLLVLLAAFMGDRWREAYDTALNRGYRFLSFGDAMLASRNNS